MDLESSPSTVSVRENHNASLICKADGTPTPTIKWQREDKKPIIIKRKKKEGKRGKYVRTYVRTNVRTPHPHGYPSAIDIETGKASAGS